MATYTTFDAAREALQLTIEQTAADMGVTPDDTDEFAWDLCCAIAYECTPDVAYELCRTELGAIPTQVLALYPELTRRSRELDRRIG